jgi:hypothetical protein
LDHDGVPELVAGKRYKAHNGRDPGEGDEDDVFICYYKIQDGGFYRHIIDYGKPHEGHSGIGQTFSVADLAGKGKLDLVAPGKLGLYLFRQV